MAEQETPQRTLHSPSMGETGDAVHGTATIPVTPVADVVGGSVVMEDWGRVPGQDVLPDLPAAPHPAAPKEPDTPAAGSTDGLRDDGPSAPL